MAHPRMIFECEPDNLILAQCAARWLLDRSHQRDAIIAYGQGTAGEVVFYVRRNKASILVKQDRP